MAYTKEAQEKKEQIAGNSGRVNNQKFKDRGSQQRRGNRNKPEGSEKQSPSTQTIITTASPAIANILTASSSIAVRNIAGNIIETPIGNDANIGVDNSGSRIPGVIQVAYAPLIGTATGEMTDPVNIATRNVWMAIKALYSNVIPFTADHIAKVLLSIDSIFMCYSFLKRAYGLVLAYDARNKFVPDGLLAGMDIDPADFRANIPDIRVTLNKVATQMNAFGVPAAMKFVIDHVQYANNIYRDDDTTSAQFIIPSPAFFWKMDWANDKMVAVSNIVNKHPSGTNAASANWKDASTVGRSWSTLKQLITDLVESFVNYEDVYVVCSDLRRIYADLLQITPVDLDYGIQPVFDPVFLDIMHNATYSNLYWDNWEITSVQAATNVGALSCNYSTGYATSTNPATDYRFIPELSAFTPGIYDFDVSDPTPDAVTACSNWKYWMEFAENTASTTKVKLASCGTLAIADAAVISLREFSGTLKWAYLDVSPKCVSGRYHVWIEGSSNYYDGKLQIWNKHPLINGAAIGTITWKPCVAAFIAGVPEGEIDQYVALGCDTIAKIHEAIVLDRFDASGAGSLSLTAKAKK